MQENIDSNNQLVSIPMDLPLAPTLRRCSLWQWYRTQRKRIKIGLGCGGLLVWLLLCSCTASTTSASDTSSASTQNTSTSSSSATATVPAVPTSVATAIPTPVPTRPAANPVCNNQTTNTPCVQFASIQDAAVGESSLSAQVSTGTTAGIVWVKDDITNVASSALGPASTLNNIQFACFNIQQALWYGLKSTINADGSQTIIKSSAFTEVDITFIDQDKSPAAFASCNLTSARVDKIDQAGMWNDGDYVGAWAMYDSTSFA